MKQAVMYGGGNIGRGFIGATLSQSGYEVTFIDVAEPVVKALQEKTQYPVRYVSSEGHEDVTIEHVTAVNGNDQEAASEAIANCDIMATAVGAGDAFCAGVLYAAETDMPLREALKLGACSAAASLSEVSASDGVKTKDEVLKLYELYGK